jgi:hypothetical protein
MVIKDSPLIASYSAAVDGKGGSQLAVKLRKPGKVIWAQMLPAVGDKKPRVVVDIAAQ